MAVWHTTAGEEGISIPVPGYKHAEVIYPKAAAPCIDVENEMLTIRLDGVCARLLRLW